MALAVEALNIVKRYPGGTLANDGVTLRVETGTIHAIVGENGAGKSTLMHILYGLEQPTAGSLRVGGRPVVLRSRRWPTWRGAAACRSTPRGGWVTCRLACSSGWRF
jgi:ABC-type uncharacterized transport system ATPase subunit